MSRLDEIRARADAATDGPWLQLPPWKTVHPVGSEIVSPNGDIADRIEAEADAEFIAHAREDVPYLLAEVERLRRGRNIWRDQADRTEATLARVREALDKPFNATFDGLFEHYQNICAAIERTDS